MAGAANIFQSDIAGWSPGKTNIGKNERRTEQLELSQTAD
jgi:hypothetical protein